MKNKLQNFLEALFQTISDVLSIGEKKVIPWVLNHFKGKELLEIGTKLTYYYFAFFLLLFGWKIPSLFFSPLSNIGDFLAGVFGPIAFGWLIIGYLMQNKELRENRIQAEKTTNLATKQLEFQTKSYEIDSIKKHNSIQPSLSIKKKKIEENKLTPLLEIELENTSRNPAIRLYIEEIGYEYDPEKDEVIEYKSNLNHINKLDENDILKIEILLDEGYMNKYKDHHVSVVELIISYTDTYGKNTETRTHIYLSYINGVYHVHSDLIQTTKHLREA